MSKRRADSPFKEEDQEKIRNTRLSRGLYTSWANLFLLTRPVQDKTYSRILYSTQFQPFQFIINLITLVALIIYLHVFNNVSLNESSVLMWPLLIILVGVIHIFLLFFYTCQCISTPGASCLMKICCLYKDDERRIVMEMEKERVGVEESQTFHPNICHPFL